MLNLTLARIGRNDTVKYAQDELSRLLYKMDPSIHADSRVYSERDTKRNDIIWVGLDGSCPENELDDTVFINVKNGAGIITGSNPRSVLMAVYRFMYELGCRFLRPGASGEKIPTRVLTPSDVTVSVNESASYRHRAICIEGTVSYENIKNMIDWIPKVYMNGYFVQFQTPGSFFKRYYNSGNPYYDRIHVEDDDIDAIWSRLEEEIILRGLNYHAAGHGWTCEPFGIHATNWEKYCGEIPPEAVQCFAEVNGVRELWNGDALVTNLCYSNPYVREKMTDAVVAYLRKHPSVNHLHFWLGDGKNNHCECDECRKMIPSDYYIKMLNELDEKLTAAGIGTKVVCLIYLDLLWAPEKLKINNRDRFVLMFAPITRTYTKSFTDYDANESTEIMPYLRNKIELPSSVAQNVGCLKKWQKEQELSDSFDFDYHLMWDHYNDPGYYECARILHTDMANLDKIGLNGMVSCQTNRAAFPNGLPMYAMANALWNKKSEFSDVAKDYFTAAFGENGEAVEAYLSSLSKLFCPAYMRGEKPITREEMTESVYEAIRTIDGFETDFIKKHCGESADYIHLEYHAKIARMYADVLLAKLRSDATSADRAKKLLFDYALRCEKALDEFFDPHTFIKRIELHTSRMEP